MCDILHVLPDFQSVSYGHILPSLDKASISTIDLISVPSHDIAKRAQVPPAEVAKLSDAVVQAIQIDIEKTKRSTLELGFSDGEQPEPCISTLDANIDASLGGGLRPGHVIEIAGESGVGKTQFLLTLLLSVQLPSPRGLDGCALYISTEAALSTTRLNQLLKMHPVLSTLSAPQKPTLDRVLSIQTPDLESQEHILRYQVPVAVRRRRVRLLVIDSIAANFRAEFDRPSQGTAENDESRISSQSVPPSDRRSRRSMAERRPQLVQIGAFLRNLASTENIAIVVSNQITDRFSATNVSTFSHPPASSGTSSATPDSLTLDKQQRWFTGWGDLPAHIPGHLNLKTPCLGLTWTNQISARIALIKETQVLGDREKSRRWIRVVFAPWTAPSLEQGVEYDITAGGIATVSKEASRTAELRTDGSKHE
ncbi:uncharacterized protein PV09_09219 [Verruconis gallopava]|uniref:RecA family profile 1 domain-containing protein n=1 Tax=Verruconis gallopava TaxID=253628 RepID=A0A0D1YED3_9PEZI|nr:uncharacterized protein PV09_09219 [Verruconis gallopava]KIV99046.1 hypothetical protein PV09_09219 [Verruconis gallopava]